MIFCKTKTTYDIHKDLCQKHIIEHTEHDLIGPFDKYRDENYKIYKEKCAEFRARGKSLKDINIKALTNHKPKLGDLFVFTDYKDKSNISSKDGSKYFVIADPSNNLIDDTDSSCTIKNDTGVALRKRHERYHHTNNIVKKHRCTFDPWFGRYLILCKFINAVRKVIIKRRLLKILKIFKKLNPSMISYYEKNHIGVEHTLYPDIFRKFTSPSSE